MAVVGAVTTEAEKHGVYCTESDIPNKGFSKKKRKKEKIGCFLFLFFLGK